MPGCRTLLMGLRMSSRGFYMWACLDSKKGPLVEERRLWRFVLAPGFTGLALPERGRPQDGVASNLALQEQLYACKLRSDAVHAVPGGQLFYVLVRELA